MAESIRIKETDLPLGELEQLLKKVEAKLFKSEGKRITGITLADPAGPDAGHNVIIIDASANPPPAGWVLREFPLSLNEGQLVLKLIDVEKTEHKELRCYGNVLVSGRESIVALFDPTAPGPSGDTITVSGKMSTFGGPGDTGMAQGENLAWIENEQQAAAYPGFFLPPQAGVGFGRRLRVEKFYLACRWDYSVTPKGFLAQPTTLCTVTNPRTGKSVQARPIDFGPNTATTGRVTDLSPGVADALGLKTNDTCKVAIPTPRQAPPKPPVSTANAAPGKRKVVFLTGDYSPQHVRQRQAAAEGCALTVDFHFNSNGPAAKGGEVYFRTNHQPSKNLATRIVEKFRALGLPDHGNPVKSANEGEGRAAFINHYTNTAVLLEPLFISNPAQAQWLHDGNSDRLAEAVAAAIRESTRDGDVIGLSIGHLGKDSSPSDRGARCQGGDMEATHGEAMAHAVARLLQK